MSGPTPAPTRRAAILGAPATWTMAIACLSLALSACGPMYYQQDPGVAYYGGGSAQAQQSGGAFHELSAYGSWSVSASWGRVWIPYANRTPGWRPYTIGGWVYTDYGWTWNSSEEWGWATYHYGRWGWETSLGGWVWVPGNDWAPSWVVWRSGGGCVGWAPLGPGGVVYNTANYWVFVESQHIHVHNVQTVVVVPQHAQTVYQTSVVIGSQGRVQSGNGRTVVYNAGPSAREAEAWTGQPVQPRQIATVPSAVPRARMGSGAAAGGGVGNSTSPRTPYQPRNEERPAQPRYEERPAQPRYEERPTQPGYQERPAQPRYEERPTPQPETRPAPTYEPRPAPTYEPRPAPAPEARPAPTYEPRPAPTYQPRPAPTYEPRPAPAPAPSPGASAPTNRGSGPYAPAPRSGGSTSRGGSSNSDSSTESRPRPTGRPAPAPQR